MKDSIGNTETLVDLWVLSERYVGMEKFLYGSTRNVTRNGIVAFLGLTLSMVTHPLSPIVPNVSYFSDVSVKQRQICELYILEFIKE